jgi:pyridoxamine 5'-phosphate oxidase
VKDGGVPSPTHGHPDDDHDDRLDVARMRRSYDPTDAGLREDTLPAHWLPQFEAWLADAVDEPLPEPNAMIVASAGADARPSARTVLLKGVSEDGFTFFTNYASRKGVELTANPYASLVFPWFAMRRQVIVTGTAERVPREATEAYFATRPRDSQLGAWASPQSQVVTGRGALDAALEQVRARFAETEAIPPPPHWGGILVRPATVEFWHGRIGRLHDRLRYRRGLADEWHIERLGP